MVSQGAQGSRLFRDSNFWGLGFSIYSTSSLVFIVTAGDFHAGTWRQFIPHALLHASIDRCVYMICIRLYIGRHHIRLPEPQRYVECWPFGLFSRVLGC